MKKSAKQFNQTIKNAFMKKDFYKHLFILTILAGSFAGKCAAQTIYRSIGSGYWSDSTIWQKSTNGGTTWTGTFGSSFGSAASGTATLATLSGPTSNQGVTISSGNVVTILKTSSCLNLTIQSGGQLTSAGSALSLRVGTGSTGTAGIAGVLHNDGILGSLTGDPMPVEFPATADSLTITGTGVCNIGRIRAITGNSNYPTSSIANHANDAKLIVDQNINLYTASNYCFSIPNSTVNPNDVIIYTINAGKTVTVKDPASKWENALMTSNGTITGGTYTYNINGTLDLSATLTGTSAFIPYSNAASSITINVNGTVKLGALFKADTVAGSLGSIALNINNGGLVDATATTSLNIGKTGTSSGTASTNNGNIFFVTNGTGALKRAVNNDGLTVKFPIGPNVNSYNPVVLSNSGSAASQFSANVKVGFDGANTPADITKCVNRQWTINDATVASGAADTIRLSWVAADENASFSHTGVSIMNWTGSAWTYYAATISGSGTTADPYVAKAGGITSFGVFGVTSFSPSPVVFVNLTGARKTAGIQVDFANATESDIMNYSIEKSANGINFNSIALLQPKHNDGLFNSYTYLDAAPLTGNNFYRISATERTGHVIYSNILKVTGTKLNGGISVYPNPVHGHVISVQLAQQSKNTYTIQLLNVQGQKVFSSIINHDGGSATHLIELPAELQRGIYTIQAISNTDTFNSSLIIE